MDTGVMRACGLGVYRNVYASPATGRQTVGKGCKSRRHAVDYTKKMQKRGVKTAYRLRIYLKPSPLHPDPNTGS